MQICKQVEVGGEGGRGIREVWSEHFVCEHNVGWMVAQESVCFAGRECLRVAEQRPIDIDVYMMVQHGFQFLLSSQLGQESTGRLGRGLQCSGGRGTHVSS